MKVNWLWDSRLEESEVKKILKDENHPKFDIYAEKLFSRINNPKVVFEILDKILFCKKWPGIKKRMRKDQWLKSRVLFWQTIYEQVYGDLKARGIKIRKPQETEISEERMKLAQQLKSIRKKLGYTQEELARKMGVIQQYISKIESGNENVSVDTLKRIADVLGKNLIIKFS